MDLDEDGTATFSGNTVVQGTLDVNDATTVSTDSKTAFQIQNASGTSAFVADTNNSIIRPDTRASSTLSLTRTATAVDSTNDVGQYTSTVIGTDGLPTIAYYDVTNADLRIARCDDLDCTSASSAAVATTGDVGKYLAMTLGTDKYPIISYYDATNGDLKVLKCGNDACSSGNTTTTLDSTGDVGQYTSITKTSTGLPRIAYYDVTNADLKLASCSTTDCTSSSLSTVDSTGDVGQYASIMLTDGGTSNVLISYYDATNGNLKTAYSFFGFTITTVDSTGDVGQHTSIAPGTDGLPLISYYDVTNGDLKAADCGDVACSTGNTISTAYSTGDIGKYTSLKRMPGGSSMLLSYYDVTNGDLKTCTSITFCTTFGGEETPDSTGDVGQYTAVAVGSDNLPLVSYYDVTNGDLKIVKCANTACDASTTTGFGGGVTLGTAGSSFQSIYFDTLNLGNEDAAVRLDASGDFTANGLTAESDGTVSTGDLTVQDTINVLDTNGDWTFQTSSSGTAKFRSTTNSTGAFLVWNAASTMVFRVDTTNGRVGVGSSAPSDTLDVDGDVRVGTGTTGCVKDADATVIAGTCSSDIRLKKNIEKNESVLDSFGQLGVVNYDWRADEFPDYSLGTARQTGLVAQDVEALFPQLVHTDENGYKTLDYTGLGILNIQATTELDAKTDDLEERVSALEDIQGGDSTFETLAAASATVDELTVEKLAIVGELIVEGDARVKGDLKVDGSLEIGADERGNNVSVEEGRDYLQIAFEESRANTDYNVQITPNWLTVTAVTEKTAGGFTVRFKDPAPAGATFDWLVVE
ncbi:MAG: tail fiber domain-containing protein [Patescibacteria group bacterium]